MIFKSTWPDADIPTTDLSSYILEGAAARGDKAALIDGPTGRTITYAELAYAVDRVAAGLAARGFGKGDVFAIFSPNIPEYAVAFHGVVRSGGTVTPINPQ